MQSKTLALLKPAVGVLATVLLSAPALAAKPIIHDAEYYIIEAQNGESWQADDKNIDEELAALRKKNGGKPPNIVYILLDDLGFGEIGMPDMDVTRGYSTPNISALAKDGLSLQRMYTEPSCTPTRVAMMTGRYPVRTGMTEAKATLAGEGLHGDEVTIAEILTKAGYYTSHVGKWHLGDIQQAWPNEQGFIHAEFPIHQQGQLGIMHPDAELANQISGADPLGQLQTYTLDNQFVANPSHMVTGVETRDGKLYEVDLKQGELWSSNKYLEMNQRYQRNALKELRKAAKMDKPFFLNYWPLYPLAFTRNDITEYRTLNGGTVPERLQLIDDWVGEIIDEVDKLGIADNTIILVMGDNGPFMQYVSMTGASDRIYRGGKAEHLEGGVRVNAFMRWPGVLEPGSYVNDIIHVTDLFTTFARLADATDDIPRDRVIDGVDQTGMLVLGDTHGRRDYVHVYEGPLLKSVVKNKYKMHLPPPGSNPIAASIFDLTRDPREQRPEESVKYGVWAGGQFAAMAKRHMIYKMKYPDRPPTYGVPYTSIENLRPETKQMLKIFKAGLPQKP